MKWTALIPIALVCAALSPWETRAASLPPLIPREHFFDNPEKILPQISPDGTRLAYLAPEAGRLNVYIRTLGKNDDRAVTHDRQRGIQIYFWSRDGKKILYLQDQGGNENYHIYAADPSNPDAQARDLTPFENVRAEIIRVPRATPDEILVSLNKRDPRFFDAYRLNIATGALDLIAENNGNIAEWVADVNGKLRAAMAFTADGGREVFARDSETAPWKSVTTYSIDDLPRPFAFTPDGKGLYMGSSRDSEFKRLVRLDLATGTETVVDQDAESDLEDTLISARTNEILAAVYTRERAVYHIFDARLKKDFERIQKAHPGDVIIEGFDDAEDRWVVTYNDDRDPYVAYLYDRTTGKAEFLFRPFPKLNPVHMAPMEPIVYKSRDGLTIRGYLTMPRGVPAKKLPMVLNVHGGPWHRDVWGFNPEVQFLANRGYAVLRVNFRGSTGYGKGFARLADHQFARKMHDDLIDAVDWAVRRGIADPKRIAIYGASYGGYATLVGLTFTPNVFARGVDYVGPSSLITLIKSFPAYWKPFLQARWYRYVGNPDDPQAVEDMKSRSPLYFVDRIKRPLFIAQGANDVRVTKAESDQIVEALKKAGKPVEYMVTDDEGHGFMNPENQFEFYRRMERFLNTHIGGRAQTDDAGKGGTAPKSPSLQ